MSLHRRRSLLYFRKNDVSKEFVGRTHRVSIYRLQLDTSKDYFQSCGNLQEGKLLNSLCVHFEHVCFLCSLKGPNANEHEKRDERYLSRVTYGGEMRKKSCYVAKTEVLRGTGLINHPHVSHVQNIMQRTASHCCEINHSSLTQEPEDSDLQRKLIFCFRLLMMMN